MFEKLIGKIIEEKLGQYLLDFNRKQLRVAAFKGDIQLENLKLNPNAFDELDLPVQIKAGYLGKLRLKLSIAKLIRAPVIVNIEDLYFVCAPYDAYDGEREAQRKRRVQRVRLKQDEATRQILRDGPSRDRQVTVRNLHMVFEDRVTDPERPYTLGIVMESFRTVTTNEKWEDYYDNDDDEWNYRVAYLENFGMYWNADKFYRPLVGLPLDQLVPYLARTLVRGKNPEDPIRRMHRFLLHPVSLRVELTFNSDEANLRVPRTKADARITGERFAVDMDSTQLVGVFTVQDYMKDNNAFLKRRGFRPRRRPVYRDPRTGSWMGDLEAVAAWWEYAYQMVLEAVRKRRATMSIASIVRAKVDLKAYIALYKKLLCEEERGMSGAFAYTDAQELAKEEIENRFPVDVVKYFRDVAEAEFDRLKPTKSLEEIAAQADQVIVQVFEEGRMDRPLSPPEIAQRRQALEEYQDKVREAHLKMSGSANYAGYNSDVGGGPRTPAPPKSPVLSLLPDLPDPLKKKKKGLWKRLFGGFKKKSSSKQQAAGAVGPPPPQDWELPPVYQPPPEAPDLPLSPATSRPSAGIYGLQAPPALVVQIAINTRAPSATPNALQQLGQLVGVKGAGGSSHPKKKKAKGKRLMDPEVQRQIIASAKSKEELFNVIKARLEEDDVPPERIEEYLQDEVYPEFFMMQRAQQAAAKIDPEAERYKTYVKTAVTLLVPLMQVTLFKAPPRIKAATGPPRPPRQRPPYNGVAQARGWRALFRLLPKLIESDKYRDPRDRYARLEFNQSRIEVQQRGRKGETVAMTMRVLEVELTDCDYRTRYPRIMSRDAALVTSPERPHLVLSVEMTGGVQFNSIQLAPSTLVFSRFVSTMIVFMNPPKATTKLDIWEEKRGEVRERMRTMHTRSVEELVAIARRTMFRGVNVVAEELALLIPEESYLEVSRASHTKLFNVNGFVQAPMLAVKANRAEVRMLQTSPAVKARFAKTAGRALTMAEEHEEVYDSIEAQLSDASMYFCREYEMPPAAAARSFLPLPTPRSPNPALTGRAFPIAMASGLELSVTMMRAVQFKAETIRMVLGPARATVRLGADFTKMIQALVRSIQLGQKMAKTGDFNISNSWDKQLMGQVAQQRTTEIPQMRVVRIEMPAGADLEFRAWVEYGFAALSGDSLACIRSAPGMFVHVEQGAERETLVDVEAEPSPVKKVRPGPPPPPPPPPTPGRRAGVVGGGSSGRRLARIGRRWVKYTPYQKIEVHPGPSRIDLWAAKLGTWEPWVENLNGVIKVFRDPHAAGTDQHVTIEASEEVPMTLCLRSLPVARDAGAGARFYVVRNDTPHMVTFSFLVDGAPVQQPSNRALGAPQQQQQYQQQGQGQRAGAGAPESLAPGEQTFSMAVQGRSMVARSSSLAMSPEQVAGAEHPVQVELTVQDREAGTQGTCRVPVARIGTYVVPLADGAGYNLGDVACEVSHDADRNEFRVSVQTALLFRNHMPVPLEIAAVPGTVDDPRAAPQRVCVAPAGGVAAVPLSCCDRGRFAIRPAGDPRGARFEWSEAVIAVERGGKAPAKFDAARLSCPASGGAGQATFAFALQVRPVERYAFAAGKRPAHAPLLLEVLPPLTVENLTASAVALRLVSAADGRSLLAADHVEAAAGDKPVPCTAVLPQRAAGPLQLSVALLEGGRPGAWSEPVDVGGAEARLKKGLWLVVPPAGLRVRVDLDTAPSALDLSASPSHGIAASVGPNPSRRLLLSVPYFVVNKLPVALRLFPDTKDERALQAAASGGAGALHLPPHRAGARDSIAMYGGAEEKSLFGADPDKVRIALADAGPVPIDEDPTDGTEDPRADGQAAPAGALDVAKPTPSTDGFVVPLRTRAGGLHEVSVVVAKGAGKLEKRTRVVTLAPRLVLVNLLDRAVEACQTATNSVFRVERGETVPISWPSAETPRLARVRLAMEGWHWSGPFHVDRPGMTAVRIVRSQAAAAGGGAPQPGAGVTTSVLRVNVQLKAGCLHAYIAFENDKDQAQLKIENELDEAICVFQAGAQGPAGLPSFALRDTVAPGKAIPFGWTDASSQDLRIAVAVGGRAAPTARPAGSYNWDNAGSQVDYYEEHEVMPAAAAFAAGAGASQGRPVVAITYLDGTARVLRITDERGARGEDGAIRELREPEEKKAKQPYRPVMQFINIKFPAVQVSLCDDVPREYLLVTLRGFELVLHRNVGTQGIELALSAEGLQVDNQLFASPLFPVIIGPSTRSFDVTTKAVELVLHRAVSPIVQAIRRLHLRLKPLDVKLDEETLMAYIQLFKGFKAKSSGANHAAHLAGLVAPPELVSSEPKLSRFESVHISPLEVDLTFRKCEKRGEEARRFEPVTTLFRAIGGALVNIDRAPLRLSSFEFDAPGSGGVTQAVLKSAVKKTYVRQVLPQVAKVLGSVELLGSPMAVGADVAQGLIDFVQQPMRGAEKGAAEFGHGVVRGTASLLKNTVLAPVSTTSRIAKSLSRGMDMLSSYDEDYVQARAEEHSEIAVDAADGLLLGARNLGLGFWRGISGVVMDPVRGAEVDGAAGAALGVGRGLVGLVVKPVTGSLDFVAKVTEGISNTPDLLEPKMTADVRRTRLPRCPGPDALVEPYSAERAELYRLLRSTAARRGPEGAAEAIVAASRVDSGYHLIVTSSRLLLVKAPKPREAMGPREQHLVRMCESAVSVWEGWQMPLEEVASFAPSDGSAAGAGVGAEPEEPGVRVVGRDPRRPRVVPCADPEGQRAILRMLEGVLRRRETWVHV
eukprot:tig00000042_g15491.t1